jgi:hypothetical protein
MASDSVSPDHDGAHSHRAPDSLETSQIAEPTVLAEFKPTCLCGCSETRSTIGGGAARLGRVIPGAVLAVLFEPEPVAPLAAAPPLFDNFDSEIDPTPV